MDTNIIQKANLGFVLVTMRELYKSDTCVRYFLKDAVTKSVKRKPIVMMEKNIWKLVILRSTISYFLNAGLVDRVYSERFVPGVS